MYRHRLDVSGAQRASLMEKAALNDRGVPDERIAVPEESMHATERMLPVVVGHLVPEHHVEQRARCAQRGRFQVGGVADKQISKVIGYLRHFCRESGWPRGELNLPRAIVTEKAYPEDEEVISTAVNARGTHGSETHIVHEQRFGVHNQIEVDVPIIFRDQNRTWYGGVGDATLGVKRVFE